MEFNYNIASQYVGYEPQYEVNDGTVLTVPDMSYSIRELLERFTTNTLPQISKEGYYASERQPEGLDFDDYDETQNPDFDLSDVSAAVAELEFVRAAHKKSKATKEPIDNEVTKVPSDFIQAQTNTQVQNGAEAPILLDI